MDIHTYLLTFLIMMLKRLQISLDILKIGFKKAGLIFYMFLVKND
jgi:hypothetical protein